MIEAGGVTDAPAHWKPPIRTGNDHEFPKDSEHRWCAKTIEVSLLKHLHHLRPIDSDDLR